MKRPFMPFCQKKKKYLWRVMYSNKNLFREVAKSWEMGKNLNSFAWFPWWIQVHKLLKGLPPIRSLFAVSSGTSKLVSLPIKSYRKDGKLLKGMQRGNYLRFQWHNSTINSLKITVKFRLFKSSTCDFVWLRTEINHPVPLRACFILFIGHNDTFPLTFKHVTVCNQTRSWSYINYSVLYRFLFWNHRLES